MAVLSHSCLHPHRDNEATARTDKPCSYMVTFSFLPFSSALLNLLTMQYAFSPSA